MNRQDAKTPRYKGRIVLAGIAASVTDLDKPRDEAGDEVGAGRVSGAFGRAGEGVRTGRGVRRSGERGLGNEELLARGQKWARGEAFGRTGVGERGAVWTGSEMGAG